MRSLVIEDEPQFRPISAVCSLSCAGLVEIVGSLSEPSKRFGNFKVRSGHRPPECCPSATLAAPSMALIHCRKGQLSS